MNMCQVKDSFKEFKSEDKSKRNISIKICYWGFIYGIHTKQNNVSLRGRQTKR